MRPPVAPLALACFVFAQCAVLVCSRGCFDPAGRFISDASYSCALQFFATGMEGKKVSVNIINPRHGNMKIKGIPFDHEKAVVEFSARAHVAVPPCLHLEQIEVTFRAPYPIDSIDKLILDSFQGEVPATQEPLGECFTIEQRDVRPGGQTITTVYGTVYIDLWCAFLPGKGTTEFDPPQQMAFEQRGELQSGC